MNDDLRMTPTVAPNSTWILHVLEMVTPINQTLVDWCQQTLENVERLVFKELDQSMAKSVLFLQMEHAMTSLWIKVNPCLHKI